MADKNMLPVEDYVMKRMLTKDAKLIRQTYGPELENFTGKKIRNCFFLVTGTNGKDYYVFQGNNQSILGVCEITDFFTDYETHRWL